MFSHEALLYEGLDDFVARTAAFVGEGVRAGEPVMVAVTADKATALREALGGDADVVEFADMAELGRNPGRIIPAWSHFLDARRRPGAPVRGIGEPIWAGRSPEELVECQIHEALLNAAFADTPDFRLMCPYDVGALDPAVIHEARCSHPLVIDNDVRAQSAEFRAASATLEPFPAPLAAAPSSRDVLGFDKDSLDDVRDFVDACARDSGLAPWRRADFVLAVHEVAANSVRHGGGLGVLRAWAEPGALVCEVKDRGRIGDPLAGRRTRGGAEPGGRGLLMAHTLCDLVQVRSDADGTTVRLRVRVPREEQAEAGGPASTDG